MVTKKINNSNNTWHLSSVNDTLDILWTGSDPTIHYTFKFTVVTCQYRLHPS